MHLKELLPGALGDHVISKALVIDPFNYFKQIGYLKIFIGAWDGPSCPQIFRLLKRTLELSIYV